MTNTPSPTDEDRELIAKARTLLVEFIADQFDDGTRSQEYWDWFNGEIGTRLESLLSDRAKLEEALSAAFDFLGGVDGAADIRDQLLAALNRSTGHTP